MHRRALLIAAVVVGWAIPESPCAAQATPMPRDSGRPLPAIGSLLAGGVFGGAIGTGLGVIGAMAAGGTSRNEVVQWTAAISTFAVCEGLGVAGGVKLAGARTDFGRLAAASLGVTALAAAGIAMTGRKSTPAAVMFVSIPVLQLGTTIALARHRR